MSKSRNWCFTSPKYLSFVNDIDKYKELPFKYMICQVEEAPTTGYRHVQGYIEFDHPVSMKRVKDVIKCDKAHVEPRKGSAEQVRKILLPPCCAMLSHADPCCAHFLDPYCTGACLLHEGGYQSVGTPRIWSVRGATPGKQVRSLAQKWPGNTVPATIQYSS